MQINMFCKIPRCKITIKLNNEHDYYTQDYYISGYYISGYYLSGYYLSGYIDIDQRVIDLADYNV